MATVWELIIESSVLPEQNDFWDHINNLGTGDGITSYVEGIYSVSYLGESEEIVSYVTEKEINISYIESPKVDITYLGESDNLITYINPKNISVSVVCKS